MKKYNKKQILIVGEVTDGLRQKLTSGIYSCDDDLSRDDYDALIVRGMPLIGKNIIERQSNLKVIISAGIGLDNVDINLATKRNISVANCPYASAISVAEHTLGLLLAISKKINQADSQIKESKWDRSTNLATELNGKRIAVIGLGAIGAHVAQLYKSIGMEVIGYDPFLHKYNFSTRNIRLAETLEEAVKDSNFISLHVAKNPKTINLIKDKHIKLLVNPNGIINTCRGGIVSEDLIEKKLDSQELGFYVADVFETEPKPKPSLVSRRNVVATPHIAANSIEAQEQIIEDVYTQLEEVFIANKKPKYTVN
ncbi:MAG: hypothetical protein GF364_01955 [Candidatus Lokiarchaeota archaeon]|nr:hypothetical protein [Candidatus Lokiarchaeota archaeon]